jgi:hypothetical protein
MTRTLKVCRFCFVLTYGLFDIAYRWLRDKYWIVRIKLRRF